MIVIPSKSDSLKVGPEYDRRRKLTEAQKEEIKKIYASGTCGMRPLAKQFGVSRTTIQIIVNPERAAKVKQRTKNHWKDYQRPKEERAATMREHRRYKQMLYEQGKIKEEGH